MDELWKLTIEEIALEGRRGDPSEANFLIIEGCLLSSVFVLVEQHHGVHLDDFFRQFLYARLIAAKDKVDFVQRVPYLIPRPPSPKQILPTDDAQPRPLHRPDLPPLLADFLPTDAGAQAHVVACAAVRLSILGLTEETCTLREDQFAVLEMIGRARWGGVLQSTLTQTLRYDNRAMFYITKMLEEAGLV